MALTQCPECSGQVSTTLTACPHCGFYLSSIQQQEPPLVSGAQPPPLPGPVAGEDSRDSHFGDAAQRIKLAKSRSYYPVKSPGVNKVWIIGGLFLVCLIWGILLNHLLRPEVAENVVPRSKVSQQGRRISDPYRTAASQKSQIDSPESIMARRPRVQLPPAGYEETETESFDFSRGDPRRDDIESLEGEDSSGSTFEPLQADDESEDEGFRLSGLGGENKSELDGSVEESNERVEAFLEEYTKGMGLFDHAEYTELIDLFQAFASSEIGLAFTQEGQDRKEELELWMLWADFLSAVQKAGLGPMPGGSAAQGQEDRYVRITLSNGEEVEGKFVSEDTKEVVLDHGTSKAGYLLKPSPLLIRPYVKKQEFVTRKIEAEPLSQGTGRGVVKDPLRTLTEIEKDLKSLTLDEVLYLCHMGPKVRSKDWTTSVLKMVPKVNPEFVESVFIKLVQQRNTSFIGKLKFHIPRSHLLLARSCKEGGLNSGFARHRLQYLACRREIASENSTKDLCRQCKGAGEGVCETCDGDKVEEVAEREACSACASQGKTNCKTCYGRGEVTCSICRGYGRRTYTKLVYGVSLSGGSTSRRSVTVSCPKVRKCKTCRGKKQVKCSRCGRSKTVKIKMPCEDCNVVGLVECNKCGGGGLKINIEAQAPGAIFDGSISKVWKELNALYAIRRNLTTFEYQERRSSLWKKHLGQWILCAGEVFDVRAPYSSYSSDRDRMSVSLKVSGIGKGNEFTTRSTYSVYTDNLHFAKGLGKGDFVKLWVPLGTDPGAIDFRSMALIPLGPFENLKEASVK